MPRQEAHTGLPTPSTDVVARELEDEVVLVHLRTNKIYALNQTGARFWQLLVDGASRAEVESILRREYDVAHAEITDEIDLLIAELVREGIVTATAPS